MRRQAPELQSRLGLERDARVVRLLVERNNGNLAVHLWLAEVSAGPGAAPSATIQFEAVSGLELRFRAADLYGISVFIVEPVEVEGTPQGSRGLRSVAVEDEQTTSNRRYHVTDFEEEFASFYCEHYSFADLQAAEKES